MTPSRPPSSFRLKITCVLMILNLLFSCSVCLSFPAVCSSLSALAWFAGQVQGSPRILQTDRKLLCSELICFYVEKNKKFLLTSTKIKSNFLQRFAKLSLAVLRNFDIESGSVLNRQSELIVDHFSCPLYGVLIVIIRSNTVVLQTLAW